MVVVAQPLQRRFGIWSLRHHIGHYDTRQNDTWHTVLQLTLSLSICVMLNAILGRAFSLFWDFGHNLIHSSSFPFHDGCCCSTPAKTFWNLELVLSHWALWHSAKWHLAYCLAVNIVTGHLSVCELLCWMPFWEGLLVCSMTLGIMTIGKMALGILYLNEYCHCYSVRLLCWMSFWRGLSVGVMTYWHSEN